MSIPATDLRNMSDDDIWRTILEAGYETPLYQHGLQTLQMRNAERQTKASADQARAASDLVKATQGLVTSTGRLVWATGVLAFATVVLFIATIVELMRS